MNKSNSLKVEIPEKKAYSYEILIGENLLAQADELVHKYSKANKFLIVTNETVAKLYRDSLNIEGAVWLVLKDGEEQKNFDTLKLILDAAVENRLERNDCIIAFGGGVVGDMAGFAAASYMRGCDFIQIPTTLLAQVDSSVGGKVAINHEHGKNLIGAFYQPKVVLADISVLKTLDLRQLKTGLAEVLKYAFIEKSCGSPLNYRLFDFLNRHKKDIFDLNPETMSKLVNICCTLKACVVNQDETEKGIRAILNLGHTYAHAIENLTNYAVYTHGEAVAIGMKMAFKLSLNRGFITKDYYDDAIWLIDEYMSFPQSCCHSAHPTNGGIGNSESPAKQVSNLFECFDKEKFYDEMFLDKKAQNGKVRFVLPNAPFSVTMVSDVRKEQVFESLD